MIAIENTRLFEAEQASKRDLQESLEYQTAISSVLSVISRSTFDLKKIFETLVESAARLCRAEKANIWRLQGKDIQYAAAYGFEPDFMEYMHSLQLKLHRGMISGRAALEGRIIHVHDVLADPEFTLTGAARLGGVRTALGVPLMREGNPIGGVFLTRPVVEPFTRQQINLVATFADQAVIAIENARLFDEVQARTREVTEALEYQTATSEVLGVISRSPNKVQPVLDTIVQTAQRLCQSDRAQFFMLENGKYCLSAYIGTNPEFLRYLSQNPISAAPGSGATTGRAARERRTIHVPDTFADPESASSDLNRTGRGRSVLSVPLLRRDVAIGVITVAREAFRAFTDAQIELVETFADQALIAIENARLFEEVEARTKELTESLEYQTATSDILNIISRSPTDVQPVFDTIAANALRLCDATFSAVSLYNGELLELVSVHNLRHPQAIDALRRAYPRPPAAGGATDQAILTREIAYIPDVLELADYQHQALAQATSYRSIMAVPILRHGTPVGAITVTGASPGMFNERQIELLKTFADQAVIAIENTRLFEQVQASNRELRLALEQQTATSELLKVIGRFTFDLKPVFETLIESAVKLCGATRGFVARFDGEVLRFAAGCNVTPELKAYFEQNPFAVDRHSNTGRAALERRTIHNVDVRADPEYTYGGHQVDPYRTVLAIPMLKADDLLGVILIYRHEVLPFTDSQIALMKTFADQAVIAIENTRLFEEVQARTRELTRSVDELRSLGEVGQTVSSSLDLSKVLQTVVEQASAMSYATGGAIYVFDKASGEFHLEAGHNMNEEHIARVRSQPMRLGDPIVGECAALRRAVQVADLKSVPTTPLLNVLTRVGVRAILAVPLLHQGEVIGALAVRRNQPGSFAPDIVRLLEAFAAQSAIAVHNARLFKEVEETGRALALASQHKSQFVANMSHELRTPLAAILGYAELLKEGIYGGLPDQSTPIVGRIQSNGTHLLGLINTVLDLSKIEAGQFSLNMSEYALDSMVENVRVATESLAQGKNLALKTDVPKGLPYGVGDEQRLTQVLLNLVGNAIKFTDVGEVRIAAGVRGGRFAVAVTDTGPGIPTEEQHRIFEEFHQVDNSSTKKKGGTGLGLAIAKQIVEMHGGRIWVESSPGKGSTFRMEVPVRAPNAKGAA